MLSRASGSNLLVDMDAQATGFGRTERLPFMLKNDRSVADGVRTIAATATATATLVNNEGKDINGKVGAAAIIRQEQRDGPFVIGPMMGSEQAVLPLIRALARSVPDRENVIVKIKMRSTLD